MIRLLTVALLFASFHAVADTEVPYTFTDGTPAKASEVNKNNDALEAAIDAIPADAIEAVTSADLDMNGNRVLFSNVYSQLADLPSASANHGMFAHVHETGEAYYAHAGNWVQIAKQSSIDAAATGFGNNTNWGAAGDNCIEQYIGEVFLTAGNVAIGTLAEGQLLPISLYPSAFAVLGNFYGGDGVSSFALPDLRNAAPDGLTYSICITGLFPRRY